MKTAVNTQQSLHLWLFTALMFIFTISCSFAQDTQVKEISSKPTLYIIGDSTVHNSTHGQMGWGDPIKALFDAKKIKVENHAIGGRSSRTFLTEGRWDAIMQTAKPGDFVIMQFGHNDSNKPDDKDRPRGTLHGIGDETVDIINPQTNKPETVHTYGWYMRKYIADAKNKQMIPIVVSPVPRVPKEEIEKGSPHPSTSGYGLWSGQTAKQNGAYFIDLSRIILNHYAGLGPDDIKAKYFTEKDNTHTNPVGAELNAECVVEGLKELTDCPLNKYLLNK